MVLNVNTGCNLSCTYCYKEDLDKPSAGKKMSIATAEASVEMLLKERERMGKALLWTWGEKENPGQHSKDDRGKGKTKSSSKLAGGESDKENASGTVEEDGRRRHGQGQAYRYKYAKRT